MLIIFEIFQYEIVNHITPIVSKFENLLLGIHNKKSKFNNLRYRTINIKLTFNHKFPKILNVSGENML